MRGIWLKTIETICIQSHPRHVGLPRRDAVRHGALPPRPRRGRPRAPQGTGVIIEEQGAAWRVG